MASEGRLRFEFDVFLLRVYARPPMPETDQYRQLLDAWMGGSVKTAKLLSEGAEQAEQVLREFGSYAKDLEARG